MAHRAAAFSRTPHPRLGRLFNRASQRSFMVAFDRTLLEGPAPFGVDARTTLAKIVEAGPEAVLMGPGLIKQAGDLFAFHGAPAIVARIDLPLVAEFRVGGTELYEAAVDPQLAASLGADAAVMCLIDGFDDPQNFSRNLEAVRLAVESCHAIGLPLIVEAVLWGQRNSDQTDAAKLARICRIAAEMGADLIKTQYPGSVEGMKQLTDGCPIPVLVLGGKATDSQAVKSFTEGAIAGGGRGVIYGRNVWQREDVAGMARTLRDLVHSA
jgi:class I fructose-bisphosphate aldolase